MERKRLNTWHDLPLRLKRHCSKNSNQQNQIRGKATTVTSECIIAHMNNLQITIYMKE